MERPQLSKQQTVEGSFSGIEPPCVHTHFQMNAYPFEGEAFFKMGMH